MRTKRFITLKEAAGISGYSPDYIGQLIRQGKLPAKKTYSNIAWLTTKEGILEYMNKTDSKPGMASRLVNRSTQAGRFMKVHFDPFRVYRFLTYLGMLTAGALFLVLFYVLSNAIDEKIERRAVNALIIDEYSNILK